MMSEVKSEPRRFAPGLGLWLFTLGFMPILLGLGWWQLERAEQKQQLEQQMLERRQAPALSLNRLDHARPANWQVLQLQGHFDPQRIWLLDNRTREGAVGVEVLQAFRDDNGEWLLINRGWVPWPDRRAKIHISTPKGSQRLLAEALPDPGAGFRLGNASASSSGWPRLITQINLAELRQQAGLPLADWRARLTDAQSAAALRLDWPELPMRSSRHTGYAVQWFCLAGALFILFVWAGLRPEPGGNNNNDEHDR
ncbi:MAG: SURF1 family protein [Halopseudomonas sp.]|uniref:SURF1 family protein n=1 Tax=Halopseudomonas sp. TaxID=2901191 RepID=UPI0030029FAA